MTWKRPENVPFPTVWTRFEGRILCEGKPLKYRIQDITEELVKPVLDHMCRYYMVCELAQAHDGVSEDEVSKNELVELWNNKLKQRMGLVVIVEGNDNEPERIAGCNILSVTQKTDPKSNIEYKGRCMKRTIERHADLGKRMDIFEIFGVDRLLSGMGLSVAPQYNGDNISYHLLMTRVHLCEACGIPLTLSGFSHPALQHVAAKCGYENILEQNLVTFKTNGKLHFSRIKSATVVVAAKIINVESYK